MAPDELVDSIEALEAQARDLAAGLAELKARVERRDRPRLPAAETRQRLPGVEGSGGLERPEERGLPRPPEPHVEGELAEEEVWVEGGAPIVAPAAKTLAELPARAGAGQRFRISHRLRPFALVYVGLVLATATLVASTSWPSELGAVLLGLVSGLLLVALTAFEPVHRTLWREEVEQAKRVDQRPWPKRPTALLLLAGVLLAGAFFLPWAQARFACAVLTAVVAFAALVWIAGGWARELNSRRSSRR